STFRTVAAPACREGADIRRAPAAGVVLTGSQGIITRESEIEAEDTAGRERARSEGVPKQQFTSGGSAMSNGIVCRMALAHKNALLSPVAARPWATVSRGRLWAAPAVTRAAKVRWFDARQLAASWVPSTPALTVRGLEQLRRPCRGAALRS